jgi:hypothetical protein
VQVLLLLLLSPRLPEDRPADVEAAAVTASEGRVVVLLVVWLPAADMGFAALVPAGAMSMLLVLALTPAALPLAPALFRATPGCPEAAVAVVDRVSAVRELRLGGGPVRKPDSRASPTSLGRMPGSSMQAPAAAGLLAAAGRGNDVHSMGGAQ